VATEQSRLGQFLRELKQQDPLQGIPQHSRTAVAALRFLNDLLWLAHQMPCILLPTLDEEKALLCLKQALGEVAYSCAVLCMAYHIDLETLPVREKHPQEIASHREERLHQLLGQLLDQCWSHSRLFTQENLQKSKDLRQHEASIQLGCTWYVLRELARWCDANLVELMRAYRKGQAERVTGSL
jgi:hypothetical protein